VDACLDALEFRLKAVGGEQGLGLAVAITITLAGGPERSHKHSC
jgi:hypothetical protein